MITKKQFVASYLTHKSIAKEAYRIWEKEGKQHGKSDDNWRKARRLLEVQADGDYDIFCELVDNAV